MDNNENFVAEQVAENVEQTTEQTPKMFTQDEVNDIVGKAKARTRAKIEKDYQRKYGDLEETLKAGTGKQSVEELNDTFQKFYASKGIKMPQKPMYSAKDIEVLANSDADEIIRGGYEDVVEEVDRLTSLGADKMSPREKEVFRKLAAYRQNTEKSRELSKLGVSEDVYNSKEFQNFASKFNSDTSIADIYEIYAKTIPKKNIKPMGSMKTTGTEDKGVKDFYTRDEAMRFTVKDFDNNPELYKKVVESSYKW